MLSLGRTDSSGDAGDRQAGHGILDQVWATCAEEGGGLGVLPGIVARVIDAADGAAAIVSHCARGRGSRWRCCGWRGASTYPAMVESVSFLEQYLMRDLAREKGELGSLRCDAIQNGRLESDVRLCTENMGLHKPFSSTGDLT